MRLRDLAAVLAGATLLAPMPIRAQAPDAAADLARIRHRLDTSAPLRDAVETAAPPTFRTSVSEVSIDITRFWGEPDAVSAIVRPSGGPWHHEFVNMVTPDAFKGYGAIFTNREKAMIARQQMRSALAVKYLPLAIAKARKGLTERAANAEVGLALEELYELHPEARPRPAGATPP